MHTFVMQILQKLRQEKYEFEASVCDIVRLSEKSGGDFTTHFKYRGN